MVQFNKLNPLQQFVQQNGVNGQPQTKEEYDALKDFGVFMQAKQHAQNVSNNSKLDVALDVTAKLPENPQIKGSPQNSLSSIVAQYGNALKEHGLQWWKAFEQPNTEEKQAALPKEQPKNNGFDENNPIELTELIVTPDNNKSTHTIDKGDTLWGLAKSELGKDATNKEIANFVKDIIAANPGINPSKIKIGTTINMPEVETPKPPEPLMAEITPESIKEELHQSVNLDLKLNTSASDSLKA